MDILSLHNSPEHIAAQTAAIGQTILRESGNLKQPNFERIGVEDLARLFDLYDRAFFGGFLGQVAKEQTGRPPAFRLSTTMIRSGGKTTLYRRRVRGVQVQAHYEIAVASRLLFMTFGQVERPVIVCGLACTNRLEALQRILEHEIIHMAEWIVCGKSGCGGRRFKTLAANIFGHTGTKHALVTPREHAAARHGIRVGSLVSFDIEGRRLVGRVNRAHSRATVLVEDAKGVPYTDGKRYQKFYVPFAMLSPAAACGEGV